MVGGREGDDIAFSSNSFCAEQSGGQGSFFAVRVVAFLLLLDSTVVVDENEGAVKLRILLAVGPCVSRTQIALSRVNVQLAG